MRTSGFFVFNVSPIYWCKQLETKKTVLRSKARVSMLGIAQNEQVQSNPVKYIRKSRKVKRIIGINLTFKT